MRCFFRISIEAKSTLFDMGIITTWRVPSGRSFLLFFTIKSGPMSSLTSFFLFCAGADTAILKRTPTDVNKYAGIGATVFFTGVFAAISGGFALFAVFKSVTVAIAFGILWGLMIFNLDRYIVMSIKKKGSKWNELAMALPRLVLAVLIAFVIAKPLELKLFESEIRSELVLKEQEKFNEHELAVRERFAPSILAAKLEMENIQGGIEQKRTTRDQLNTIAIQEADGTGGSGNRNLGPIYKAKKRDADLAQAELDAVISSSAPLLLSKREQIAELEEEMQTALLTLEKSKLDGFAAQLDALGNLSDKSKTIFWASIFITLLFIAIETAPLFVKLISERSPYDYRLSEHESKVALLHDCRLGKLSSATESELRYAREADRYEALQAIGAEKEVVKAVIGAEVEKLKTEVLSWQDYKAMGRKFS